jgi:DNA-binding winged helix-turn-helix (wHTH) protein/tetratricopeptide (TPR) repeat protein/TolB-like protein
MSSRRFEVTNDRRKIDEFGASPPDSAASRCLGFGPFILDPETERLLEGGKVVSLAHKPFETLHYLAGRPGRVVSKSELMEHLWPETYVTDDVLVQCVVDIRRALHDQARTPQFIQTIPKKGYQFVAPVHPADLPAAPNLAPPPPPPRKRPSWALGLAALTVLAVGLVFAFLQFSKRAEVGQAPAEPGSLVVMPVLVEEGTHESDWLRLGLAEMIRSELGQAPGIHVVARHRLAAALAEAGFSEDSGPTATIAAQLARKLRAERLVTASFVRVDNRFVLTAQVVNVASGSSEVTAAVKGIHPGDLLDAVDELCLKLLHHLHPPEATVSSFRPARLTTRSVEASRKYIEALALFTRGGRQGVQEAETDLDEALKLDPGFAQAYVKKAEIQWWCRRWGYGEPDPAPAVLAAARLVTDLPDRERLLVESFEALIVRNQTEMALRDWNTLLQFYPTYAQEVGIPGLVAETFAREGRWDELISVGEAHVDSSSLPDGERAFLSSLLATAFRRKGEFHVALLHATRAVKLWPSQEGPRFLSQRTALGRIALEDGERSQAIGEFRATGSAPGADATNLTEAAWGLYMAGETGEAASLVERALAQDRNYGNAYHLRGWLALARKDYASAVRDLDTAFERTSGSFGYTHQGMVSGDLAALYYAGVASEKLGAGDRDLKRLLDLLGRLSTGKRDEADAALWQVANFRARAAARLGETAPEPPRLQGDDTTYFVQSARLLAVQGATAEAMKDLAQGLSLGHGEYRHIDDDPDFESLRGLPEFKRLVIDRVPHP